MLFRGHWGQGLLLLVIAVPLALFGLSGICVTFGEAFGVVWFPWVVTAFGLLFVYAGLDLVYRHFIVDDEALVRKAGLGREQIRIGWDEIRSWLVYPTDDSHSSSAAWRLLYPDAKPAFRWTIENRGILIRTETRWAALFIADWEVAIPSVDAFLVELRLAVGDREVRISGKALPQDKAEPQLVSTGLEAAIQAPIASP